MVRVKGTTITMTKGDTLRCKVTPYREIDGEDVEYVPVDGDEIRFAMKQSYRDGACTILKTIPNDTLVLELEPDDTKYLNVGEYVYDIQLTYGIDGAVDTFIANAQLILREEVD